MKVDVKPIVLAAGALLLFCGLGTFTSERFYDVSSSNYFMQFQKVRASPSDRLRSLFAPNSRSAEHVMMHVTHSED